ncbi:D-alanyl-D-alanine carboxypeptidase family protein [Ruminococcaceae bacterium OttesenSCG-928-A16]|nr:D-alanyl-D-alanine carboxypeptidase family protein [Ruminococcaceae bacterium OttesenSCG-928-A16]
MNPQTQNKRTGTLFCRSFLQLVNKQHPVATTPPETMEPALPGSQELLCHTPAGLLRALLQKTETQHSIVAVSGYRSRARQAQIYTETEEQNGVEFAQKYVALPSCSEHETGLAIDLAARAPHIDFIRPQLPASGAFGHFRAFAPQYGFIQRYTKSKTHITGIEEEPWHFRYVGWPHAEIMQKQDLALEEYIGILQGFYTPQNALTYSLAGRNFYIFTAEYEKAEQYRQEYKEKRQLCQCSGNNAGGVVVTVWQ